MVDAVGEPGSVPRAGPIPPRLGGEHQESLPSARAGATPGSRRFGGEHAGAEPCLWADRKSRGSESPGSGKRAGRPVAAVSQEKIAPEEGAEQQPQANLQGSWKKIKIGRASCRERV